MNRMSAEKISYNEAALAKLRDMMMGIIKDIKAAYDKGLPAPADEENAAELMAAMFEQAMQVKEDKGSITIEDMADIMVEQAKRSKALNDESEVLFRELCLEMLRNEGE